MKRLQKKDLPEYGKNRVNGDKEVPEKTGGGRRNVNR